MKTFVKHSFENSQKKGNERKAIDRGRRKILSTSKDYQNENFVRKDDSYLKSCKASSTERASSPSICK